MSQLCTINKPLNSFIQGSIKLNGSKSISNRVLVIDALCGNKIDMENLSAADDTVFMKRLLRSNENVLDAGAGGTTFRFLTVFLATQEGREVTLTGSERMQQRPVKILVDALRSLGADITYENKEGFPPLYIRGKKLQGGKISLPADTSSQYITALLLVAPNLEKGLELELTGTIVSVPYIRMTLKMLEYFGIKTFFAGNKITVTPGIFQPKSFFIEADWSAASYFYSAAILAEDAEIVLKGLTGQQLQGDSKISVISEAFGIETLWNNNEVILRKNKSAVKDKYAFDFIECPDLAQTVIAFCGALGVDLDCKGLQTLRIKETDRITALDNELQKMQLASLYETDSNNWILRPLGKAIENKNTIKTYEDHRMAMAFAPLCLKTNLVKIEDPEVVTKSYPAFWKDMESLGFIIDFS